MKASTKFFFDLQGKSEKTDKIVLTQVAESVVLGDGKNDENNLPDFLRDANNQTAIKAGSDMNENHFPHVPEKVKTFHTAYGEVTWYVNEKIIECQGAKFTDEEILKLKSNKLHVTDFELELKRQFPQVTLIDITEAAA